MKRPASGELGPADDSSPVIAHPSTVKSASSRNDLMISMLAIAVGAALGALLRWYFAVRLNLAFPSLPPGTLAANLLGGYLIGIAMAVFLALPGLPAYWRLLTVTGFLGGLTTFSTFSAEVVSGLLAGQTLWAFLTIVVHVFGSIAMTLLGIGTVRLARGLL